MGGERQRKRLVVEGLAFKSIEGVSVELTCTSSAGLVMHSN